jgi:hypothetical protein
MSKPSHNGGEKQVRKFQKDKRNNFNMVVVLGAWMLWKHRNVAIFIGTTPT